MSEEWVDISGDGGLMKKVLQAAPDGATSPAPGSEVSAHYTGTLESDGSKFDSSRDRGQVFKFKIGQGQVISGWDQGFASMKVGEKAILKCRSDYAYGMSSFLQLFNVFIYLLVLFFILIFFPFCKNSFFLFL